MIPTAELPTFDFDLGHVGWPDRQPFVVRLDASRLQELLNAARQGLRVYELLALHRPGDVWAYVDVRAIRLPPDLQKAWSLATRYQPEDDQRMDFEAFDLQCQWMGDDTDPEHEAWLLQRHNPPVLAYLADLYAVVKQTAAEDALQDAVGQHERRLIREGRHAYDAWTRSALIRHRQGFRTPKPSHYPPAFLDMATHLLAQPALESVAYRGQGNYTLMRLMCNEQRLRANRLGCAPQDALVLSALTDVRIDNAAWGSALDLYDEGIGWGDLWIETDFGRGASLAALLDTPFRKFGRQVLSLGDLGDLPGYGRTHGPGWTLYEALPGTAIPRPPRQFW